MTALVALMLGCSTTAPAEPPAAEPAPTPEIGAPLPPDSVVQTMQAQAVLDHPQVAMYLHTEVAENLPLKVHAVPALADGAAGLVAGGQAVVVVDDPKSARVLLTGRQPLDGARVRIRFQIDSEGVGGQVEVELTDYVWTAVHADVAER